MKTLSEFMLSFVVRLIVRECSINARMEVNIAIQVSFALVASVPVLYTVSAHSVMLIKL